LASRYLISGCSSSQDKFPKKVSTTNIDNTNAIPKLYEAKVIPTNIFNKIPQNRPNQKLIVKISSLNFIFLSWLIKIQKNLCKLIAQDLTRYLK